MSHRVSCDRVGSFYRSLRDRVDVWLDSDEAASMPSAELYAHLPELYAFLVRLALDSRVPETERAVIRSALKYIVAPYDLIPEAVVGTSGFRDDVVLAAMVVDRLRHTVAGDLLSEHWVGPGDVLDVARAILEVRTVMIDLGVCDRLGEWLAN